MTINLKQPKYILPLIALPFLVLFFYVYRSSAATNGPPPKQPAGINGSVGDVSAEVRKKKLSDKLNAYRNRYKETDGNSAVNPIPSEGNPRSGFSIIAGEDQQKTLDSIDNVMKNKFHDQPAVVKRQYAAGHTDGSANDKALAAALNSLANRRNSISNYPRAGNPAKEKDPMAVFRQQIAYMDSIRKVNDPEYQAQKRQEDARVKAAELQAHDQALSVVRAKENMEDFNTVLPETNSSMISAIIDESVTGYAGSRIRLRLLDDIMAGKTFIRKGTYLYALINGFSGQRVTLSVRSFLINGQILPVRLEVYDQDGLPGMYIPDSQFRDFTKDLGTSTMQGVTIDNGSSSGSAFVMSTAGKLFASSSTAIAAAIRKNKAKVKYNSYIFLIDTKNIKE